MLWSKVMKMLIGNFQPISKSNYSSIGVLKYNKFFGCLKKININAWNGQKITIITRVGQGFNFIKEHHTEVFRTVVLFMIGCMMKGIVRLQCKYNIQQMHHGEFKTILACHLGIEMVVWNLFKKIWQGINKICTKERNTLKLGIVLSF